MRLVYITPREDRMFAEFHEKASLKLNATIRNTPWLTWQKMQDLNGKGRVQWYVVADISLDKENRLAQFAKILCEDESYTPTSRICPHDQYYEYFDRYFTKYI